MLGDEVTGFLAEAREDALIVAPFMRAHTLSRLLESVPRGTKTRIVTRWKPIDIVAGASDLGTFDLAEARSIPLYLRQDLHAKFFGADGLCLVGSANVTNSALGWHESPNLELLVPVSRSSAEVVNFERTLFSGVVLATSDQRDRIERLVAGLRDVTKLERFVSRAEELSGLPATWLPRARNPDDLYAVYRGDADVSRAIRDVMEGDLSRMGVIPGLDVDAFRNWVGVTIRQTPLISWIVSRIESEGQINEDVLGERLEELGIDTSKHRPRDVLQTAQRWMNFFLPMQYETVQDTVKLIEAKEI